MTNYGYARVSTLKQLNNNTQREQQKKLEEYGVDQNNIYFEQFTGTKRTGRKALDEVLKTMQPGDTLVVTKLDRLARNTADALNLVQEIQNLDCKLYILNIGLFDSTPNGRLMFTMLAAFAEFEAALIKDRLQEGREYKRVNDPNYREGRKRKLDDEHLKEANNRLVNEGWSYSRAAKYYGVSRRTMIYRIKELRAKNLAS